MADTKTSDLIELVVPDAGDWLPIADISVPETKKVKFSRFVTKDANNDVALDTLDLTSAASGLLQSGVLTGSSFQAHQQGYTQTADPADELFGTFFSARWDAIIDYDNLGADQQKIQSAFFGPRGVFNVEGVVQHDAPGTEFNGLSPLSFLSVMQQKNKAGSGNIGLTPAWTYVASNWHIADGATITAWNNDTLRGPSAFIDTTLFVSAGTGHWDAKNGQGNEIHSFVSHPQMLGHVSVGTRVGFYAKDMGIATSGGGGAWTLADGSSITIDAANQAVDLQVGFRTQLLKGATVNKAIEVAPGDNTLTASLGTSSFFLDFLPGTTTLDFVGAFLPALVAYAGTLEFQQAGSAFGSILCFRFFPTLKNANGVAVGPGAVIGFVSSPTFKGDGAAMPGGTFHGFFSSPTAATVLNAGSVTGMTWNNFTASWASIAASNTVTIRRGFYVITDSTNTMSGTFTTQVGLDIEALTKAGTNIAARLTTTGMTWSLQQFGAVKSLHEGDLRVGYLSLGDTTAPNAKLEVVQPTVGNEVFRLSSVATNDDPTEQVFQARLATTDATVSNLFSFSVPASTTVFLEAFVVARRTGGTGGTAEDGAGYVVRATYKNVGGTATLIGAIQQDYVAEDQAGWDCTFLGFGGVVLIRATGAANNNITWHATVRVRKVGT